jgi:hypothetical protein
MLSEIHIFKLSGEHDVTALSLVCVKEKYKIFCNNVMLEASLKTGPFLPDM